MCSSEGIYCRIDVTSNLHTKKENNKVKRNKKRCKYSFYMAHVLNSVSDIKYKQIGQRMFGENMLEMIQYQKMSRS